MPVEAPRHTGAVVDGTEPDHSRLIRPNGRSGKSCPPVATRPASAPIRCRRWRIAGPAGAQNWTLTVGNVTLTKERVWTRIAWEGVLRSVFRLVAAAALAMWPCAQPVLAEIQITTCRFPKLLRSVIMPEVRVLFDTATGTVLIEDAMILDVKGRPIEAKVDERRAGGKYLFIVKWRVDRLPARWSEEWTRVDFVLKVEKNGRAGIETSFPSPTFIGQFAKGQCS